MKIGKVILTGMATVLLTACSSYPPIRTAQNVDIPRFMGDWYVLANIPTFIEKGAHNAVESYELNEDGTVSTTFTFREDSFDGEKKIYHPTGYILNNESNAVWGMQFIWPIKADYRIVYVSDDYNQTIIGRLKRDYVWIMARTPQVSKATYEKLITIVKEEGYDISQVQRVPQSWPEHHLMRAGLRRRMNSPEQCNTLSGSRWVAILRWFDSSQASSATDIDERKIDWLRAIPFIGLHLAVFGVFWTGASLTAVSVAVALYALRMFAITGFYHRYFSHRAFKTSRATQFIFALLGASAVQRGPLWWAAHHRLHHARSDQKEDAHSPRQKGFWWSHHGWFLSRANFSTPSDRIRDFARYPELRFLDRFDVLVPLLLLTSLYIIGEILAVAAPGLETNGLQLVVWGFVISTVALYHVTFTINSLAHRIGKRVYATRDDSRNNWLLAILTFGEGWHNNHHYYPGSARQGFHWWQIDLTYYLLRLLAWMGLIWDLRPVPQRVLHNSDADPAVEKRSTGESSL